MKRMKALLGVVLCIALVLSLSLTAFAAGGTIKVAEPGTHEYDIYKVFDATVTPATSTSPAVVTYTTDDDTLKEAINGENPSIDGYPHLIFTGSSGNWTVEKGPSYSAADFAHWLAQNLSLLGTINSTDTHMKYDNVPAKDDPNTTAVEPNMTAGVNVTEDGYYFITYDNDEPYALTSVLGGTATQTVEIQNKHDTPFDKDVYADDADYGDPDKSIDEDSVQAGQVLYYEIDGVVPDFGENTQYLYRVWDKLGKGLKLNIDKTSATTIAETVVVEIDGTPIDMEVMFRSDNPTLVHPVDNTPKGYIWINDVADGVNTLYTDDEPSFVINLDMSKVDAANIGDAITIKYNATVVTEQGVLVNTAHLVSNDLIKDADTQNYTSKIIVDKYETGNASQKLGGAQFKLFKTADGSALTRNSEGKFEIPADAKYYKASGTPAVVSWTTEGEATVKTTESDGSAEFTGLPDGIYYLVEIEAPTGYVKLDTPVEVIVNGKPSLDPNNTVENRPQETEANQNIQLQNVSHIANTPGSVLPSTGGRGTTMLYMAGLGMMLAAGAFLIFRRRAEAGK